MLKESGIGYWHDRKGENEIDIVAENELENKIVFIEVKRKSKNFDETRNILNAGFCGCNHDRSPDHNA